MKKIINNIYELPQLLTIRVSSETSETKQVRLNEGEKEEVRMTKVIKMHQNHSELHPSIELV